MACLSAVGGFAKLGEGCLCSCSAAAAAAANAALRASFATFSAIPVLDFDAAFSDPS